jgi:hypothetical protein
MSYNVVGEIFRRLWLQVFMITLEAYRLIRSRAYLFPLRIVHDNRRTIKARDVLLLTCISEGLVWMPHFVRYYRELGVNHFLFIDNSPNEQFTAWANQFDDCTIWRPRDRGQKAGRNVQRVNRLLARYGHGHLCVFVAPDEYLMYPHMETRRLRDLGQFLTDDWRDCMHALVLDSYKDSATQAAGPNNVGDPFLVSPFFDRDGYIQKRGARGRTLIQGGPFMRVLFRDEPGLSPTLDRVPVVWWRRHFTYAGAGFDLAPHRLNFAHTPGEVSLTGCLFRFGRLTGAAGDGGGQSRLQSGDATGVSPEASVSFYEDGISVRYESPAQLIQLGLMRAGSWF